MQSDGEYVQMINCAPDEEQNAQQALLDQYTQDY